MCVVRVRDGEVPGGLQWAGCVLQPGQVSLSARMDRRLLLHLTPSPARLLSRPPHTPRSHLYSRRPRSRPEDVAHVEAERW